MTDPTENPGHTPQEPRTKAGRELAHRLHTGQDGGTPHGGEINDFILAIEAEAAAHIHSPCQSCGTMEAVLCEECRPEIDVERLARALHPEIEKARRDAAKWPGQCTGTHIMGMGDCQFAARDIVARLTSSENVR